MEDQGGSLNSFIPTFRLNPFLVYSQTCTQRQISGPTKLWPLLPGGRCFEVPLCYKSAKMDPKICGLYRQVIAFGGGS